MSVHLAMYNAVAASVCKKPLAMTHEDCYRANISKHPPCRNYGKCCIFDKSEQQLEFVLQPIELESFLKACPGSGKTEVVGLFAAYAMRMHAWRHQGMAGT